MQQESVYSIKRQLPQDWFGTPSWAPLRCFVKKEIVATTSANEFYQDAIIFVIFYQKGRV